MNCFCRSDFPELFDICGDEVSGDNVDKNDNVGGGGGGGGGGGSAPQTDCPGKDVTWACVNTFF